MIKPEEVIIIVITIYTFISESLPFIKMVESNGIMHSLFLYIKKYQSIIADVESNEESNEIELLNIKLNELQTLLHECNQTLVNFNIEIDSRLNNLESKN